MAVKKDRKHKWQPATVLIHSAILMIVLIIGLWMIRQAADMIESSPYFELRSITFNGISHGDVDQLRQLVSRNFPSRSLEIDLETVRTLIESESWVKSALVRRKLPDRLIFYVTEREPAAVAAIDGELYVVDPEGVILGEFGPDYRDLDKPIVRGLENVARENAGAANRERIRVYLEVIRDLQDRNQDYCEGISEIDVGNPDRVAVYPVDDPVPIYLGNRSYRKRWENFLSQRQLYLDLKKKYGSIEYIDMTYEDRIIFHTPEENVSG